MLRHMCGPLCMCVRAAVAVPSVAAACGTGPLQTSRVRLQQQRPPVPSHPREYGSQVGAMHSGGGCMESSTRWKEALSFEAAAPPAAETEAHLVVTKPVFDKFACFVMRTALLSRGDARLSEGAEAYKAVWPAVFPLSHEIMGGLNSEDIHTALARLRDRYAEYIKLPHLLFVAGTIDGVPLGASAAVQMQAVRPRDQPVPKHCWALVAERLLLVAAHWQKQLAPTLGELEHASSCLERDETFKRVVSALIDRHLLDVGAVNLGLCDRSLLEIRDSMKPHRTTQLSFICDTISAESVSKRFIRVTSSPVVHRTLETAMAAAEATVPTERPPVLIVGGETGSGKTISALASACQRTPVIERVCIFLMPASFDAEELEQAFSGALDDAGKAKRNDAVPEAVTNAVRAQALPSKACTATAVIVIDEMGRYPAVVKALCAMDTQGLRDVLRVERVVLVLVGTGIDHASNAPGSHPLSYRRVALTSADIVRQFKHGVLKDHRALSFVLEDKSLVGETVRQMATNARLLAALYKAAGEFADSDAVTESSAANDTLMRTVMDTAIAPAMQHFKRLNGLRDTSSRQAFEHFGRAFALACDCSNRAVPVEWRYLLVDYGLVTDNARLVSSKVDVRKGDVCIGNEAPDSPTWLVVGQGEKRYAMTYAQSQLGLWSFGCGAPRWGGDGFEETMMKLLFLHLWSAATVMADDPPVMHDLCFLKDRDADPLATLKDALWRAMRAHAVVNVTTVQLTEKIHNVADMEQQLLAAATGGGHGLAPTAVLARNAPLTEYTDIAVGFVAGGVVVKTVLIQLKFYPKSKLEDFAMWAELYKMGSLSAGAVAGHVVSQVAVKKAKSDASQGGEVEPKELTLRLMELLSNQMRFALTRVHRERLSGFEKHVQNKLIPAENNLSWGRTKSKMFGELYGAFEADVDRPADVEEDEDVYIVAYSGKPLPSEGRYPPQLLLINEANGAAAFHPTGWHTNITTPVRSSTYTAQTPSRRRLA